MQVSMAPFSCKSVDDALRLLSEAKSRCEDATAFCDVLTKLNEIVGQRVGRQCEVGV